MLRYSVERVKCDVKECDKGATVTLRVFACQIRDESVSHYCTEHADFYIARLDELNQNEAVLRG